MKEPPSGMPGGGSFIDAGGAGVQPRTVIVAFLLAAALPAPAMSEADRDTGAILSAVHRYLTRDEPGACLNTRLELKGIDERASDTARSLREEGIRRPSRAAIRARIVEDQTGSWGTMTEPSEPLAPTIEAQLVAAYAVMVLAPPRQPTGRRLTRAMVDADIVLGTGCYSRLYAPAIRGDWAFTGWHSATAGRLVALRRMDGRWALVAARYTFIA